MALSGVSHLHTRVISDKPWGAAAESVYQITRAVCKLIHHAQEAMHSSTGLYLASGPGRGEHAFSLPSPRPGPEASLYHDYSYEYAQLSRFDDIHRLVTHSSQSYKFHTTNIGEH